MWQRFSENARKAVFYSQEEAEKFGEGYVSTEHILLGLLRSDTSTAYRTIARMGVDHVEIRDAVIAALPQSDKRQAQDMTLTPRAKQVIDLAYDEARNLNNDFIGTEHLFLGLVREGTGLAAKVMGKFGISLEGARQAVLAAQDGQETESGTRIKGEQRTHPEWQWRQTMSRVKEWASWATHLEDQNPSLQADLEALKLQLEVKTSEMQRNLLLGLCAELAESGSLRESENWRKLQLTEEQVKALEEIGLEVRKSLNR